MATDVKIHIVDDDVALGKFLTREFKRSHYSVDVSHEGLAACEKIQQSQCDLLVLDLNLPGMDGMTVLERVRKTKPLLPILVLTARNRKQDLVSALEHGADDCLIKPFSFQELLARVRVLLRRSSIQAPNSDHQSAPPPAPIGKKIGDLTINREDHWVVRGDRRIELTVREFELLDYMATHAGKVVSRQTLMQEVWATPFDPTTNIVDVYMKYLRDKIDRDGDRKMIRTVRGIGYVLSNE